MIPRTKALQLFSDEALERGRRASPEEIIRFIEDFRALIAAAEPADREPDPAPKTPRGDG